MGRKKSKTTSTKRSGSVKKEPLSEEKLMFLEDLERSVKDELMKIEREYQEILSNTTNSQNLMYSALGEELLNTFYHDIPEIEPLIVSSADSITTTTTKRSRSRSPVFAIPEVPAKKTVTLNEPQRCEANMFQTPADRRIPVFSKTVTPKIRQNTPMAVMRRPRQGEVALSMSGSPLLVSTENLVNINVPLENGSVLSILPQHGLRRRDIPSNLSETTRQQLQAVLHNLNVILGD